MNMETLIKKCVKCIMHSLHIYKINEKHLLKFEDENVEFIHARRKFGYIHMVYIHIYIWYIHIYICIFGR